MLPPGAGDALAALRAPAGIEVELPHSVGKGDPAAMDTGGDGNAHAGEEKVLARREVSYEGRCQRFVVRAKTYSQQFSHIYNRRLVQLQGPVKEAAARRWAGNGGGGAAEGAKVVDRLVHMMEGERWVAVGTLYKAMRLKPCVLDEYKVERGLSHACVSPVGNFSSDDDSLVLEDESGRVALLCDKAVMDPQALCTGLVVAVKGVMQRSGELLVEDWCSADLPPQPAMSAASVAALGDGNGDDPLVLLVSGLRAGGVQDPLPARLLVDYVAGYLGGPAEISAAARIARVIACGDCVAPPAAAAAAALTGRGDGAGAAVRHVSAEQQRAIAAPVAELDRELTQLAAAVATDVMPGAGDPSNFMLPQQPLHPCLLPLASRLSTLSAVPNPYEADIGGRIFLGTSGQPLDDIMKYAREASAAVATGGGRSGGSGSDMDVAGSGQPAAAAAAAAAAGEGAAAAGGQWWLELLEASLRWRHMCPTAPDTLGCFPLVEDDPFVLEECPHVYFAGNQKSFATRLVRGEGGQEVRLVCLPSFAATGEAALVNLRTLDCTPLRFSVGAGIAAPQQQNGTGSDVPAAVPEEPVPLDVVDSDQE